MPKQMGTGEQEKNHSPRDPCRNEIWQVLASQMADRYQQLSFLDMLELNQANWNKAM